MTGNRRHQLLSQAKPWLIYCWKCHKQHRIAYDYQNTGQVIPLSLQLPCGALIPTACLSAWEREIHDVLEKETYESVSTSYSATSTHAG
jgi:hypothetical protein